MFPLYLQAEAGYVENHMFDAHYYKSESKVVAVTKEIEKTITPDKVTDMYDKVRAEVETAILRNSLSRKMILTASSLR